MTTENGCLHVAPRSHLGGLVEHQVAASNPALREAGHRRHRPARTGGRRGGRVQWIMLHGSGENRTDAERVALFARYCVPTCG